MKKIQIELQNPIDYAKEILKKSKKNVTINEIQAAFKKY